MTDPSAAERLVGAVDTKITGVVHATLRPDCGVVTAPDILRAIVDELGITWEMVDSVAAVYVPGNLDLSNAELVNGQKVKRALATILEAAGVERSE